MATYRDSPLEPKRHEGSCSCELLRKYGQLEKGAADPGCPFHGGGGKPGDGEVDKDGDRNVGRDGDRDDEGVDVGELDKESTTSVFPTTQVPVEDRQEDDAELGIGSDIDGFGAM